MSEFTSYGVVHVEDLKLVCSELSRDEVTSVLLADPQHPLYNDEHLMAKWKALPFKEKWLILMTTDDVRNRYAFMPLSAEITIDENPDRWELRLDRHNESRRYLFSDTQWEDIRTANEEDGSAGIEGAVGIGRGDLDFMEAVFQIGRTEFSEYLQMGPGNARNFMRAVGLPVIEMLRDWQFYYPDEGLNQCMLWPEYDAIMNAYDEAQKQHSLDESELADDFIFPA